MSGESEKPLCRQCSCQACGTGDEAGRTLDVPDDPLGDEEVADLTGASTNRHPAAKDPIWDQKKRAPDDQRHADGTDERHTPRDAPWTVRSRHPPVRTSDAPIS